MRGSAQSFSGCPAQAARRAAWQGEFLSPVHPLSHNKCGWTDPPDYWRGTDFGPYRSVPE